MIEQFVPYELAVKLKELGFKFYSFAWYNSEGKVLRIHDARHLDYNPIEAPLWQQAFDWLFCKYNLYVFEDHRCCSTKDLSKIQYWFGIKELYKSPHGQRVVKGLIQMGCFNSYEEGRLECLKQLIKIVENND